MANYPTSLDSVSTLLDPQDDDFTTAPSHASLHRDANAVLIALETVVGIPGSVDISSHEYRVSNHQHTSASALDGGLISHGELGSVTTDQHHAKTHAHSLADGTGQLSHADLTNVSADQHHAQTHTYDSHTGTPPGGVSAHAVLSTGHTDVDETDTPATGDVLTWDGTQWLASAPVGDPQGGAPSGATYLTATADATLSNEVVVGTAPGGELGGTWAAPTVDATHSGSAHHNQLHSLADTLHHSGTISAAQHPTMTSDIHTNYLYEEILLFSQDGALPTAGRTGLHRLYVRGNWTVVSVRASVGVAPAGASLILDVRVNAVSIWNVTPANRPTIVAGSNTVEQLSFDDTTVDNGQFVTVDVVAGAWSTVPEDLVVQVFMVRR